VSERVARLCGGSHEENCGSAGSLYAGCCQSRHGRTRLTSATLRAAVSITKRRHRVGWRGACRLQRDQRAPRTLVGLGQLSTGALTSGSIFGANFFQPGFQLHRDGRGKIWGSPRGSFFDATFVGPIHWVLVSQPGKFDYVFRLSAWSTGRSIPVGWFSGITHQRHHGASESMVAGSSGQPRRRQNNVRSGDSRAWNAGIIWPGVDRAGWSRAAETGETLIQCRQGA